MESWNPRNRRQWPKTTRYHLPTFRFYRSLYYLFLGSASIRRLAGNLQARTLEVLDFGRCRRCRMSAFTVKHSKIFPETPLESKRRESLDNRPIESSFGSQLNSIGLTMWSTPLSKQHRIVNKVCRHMCSFGLMPNKFTEPRQRLAKLQYAAMNRFPSK